MVSGVDELAVGLDRPSERLSGLKAVIASARALYNPKIIAIDQTTYSHFLYRGYGMVSSFVMFSSEAREKTPKLHERLRRFLNGRGSSSIALQLQYGNIYIPAELNTEQRTYELRVKNR
jgi:hypothetical protein